MSVFQNLDDLDPGEAAYRLLKAERRSRRVALALKLLLILGLYGGYRYLQMPEHADAKERLIVTVQTRLESFLLPIVERTTSHMVEKIQSDMLSGSLSTGAAGAANSAGRRANVPSGTVERAMKNPASTLSPEAIEMLCKNLPKK